MMQYTFFTIHEYDSSEEVEELNRFLRSVQVISVAKEFVVADGLGRWHFCVEYLERGGVAAGEGQGKSNKNKDYQKILPAEDFAIFAALRTWRKEQATIDNVPVYAIFTNDQLAKIAGRRVASKGELQEIDGIGEAKVNKYGKSVLAIVAGNEESK